MRRATEIYEDRKDDDISTFGDNECVGTPEYLSPEVKHPNNFIIDISRNLIR